MSAPAAAEGLDREHDGLDESGPTTVRDTGRPGRGAVLAGKYRLEMLLGEGGMAMVWSAYNLELEVPVAVKLLRSGLNDELFTQRLRNEARAAARLVHPNIVRIFDVAVASSGDPFIVMELLTGHTLADELRRGAIDAVRAVQLLLPIADALALAHAHGIVHRDLKPDNVFLSTDGAELQPKLLDFGIAKLARASALADRLTEKGTTLGSPNYMSPEQVLGEDVDHRSDIWSFCVLLYKALAGVAPFHSADKRVTLDAILNAEPVDLALRADVDPELAALVHWGLAKDPAQRPAYMRQLAGQLSRWLRRHGVQDEVTPAPLAPKWLNRSGALPSNDLGVSGSRPLASSAESTQRIVPARRDGRIAAGILGLLLVSAGFFWATSSPSRPLLSASSPARAGATSARLADTEHAPRLIQAAAHEPAETVAPPEPGPALESPAPFAEAPTNKVAPRARVDSGKSTGSLQTKAASRLPF